MPHTRSQCKPAVCFHLTPHEHTAFDAGVGPGQQDSDIDWEFQWRRTLHAAPKQEGRVHANQYIVINANTPVKHALSGGISDLDRIVVSSRVRL